MQKLTHHFMQSVFVIIVCLFLSLQSHAQNKRDFTISLLNKDPLAFGLFNYGAHIKHSWWWNEKWYVSAGLGVWWWETFVGGHTLERWPNIVNIQPDVGDFALEGVIDVTDGKVGIKQLELHNGFHIIAPAFVGVGRSWLPRCRRFDVDTDVGLFITFWQQNDYSGGEIIGIQSGFPQYEHANLNDVGDQYYYLQVPATERAIGLGIHFSAEGSYYFTNRLGCGLNILAGFGDKAGVAGLGHSGYSFIGAHLKYKY